MLRIGEIHHFDEQGLKESMRRLEVGPNDYKRTLLKILASQGQDKAQASYVSIDNTTGEPKFAGIFVSPGDRGQTLPRLLMETAFRIGEIIGSPIETTMTIRKPLIAKFLLQYGFEPDGDGTVAEILPRQGDSFIPRVRISTRRKDVEPLNPAWYEIQEGDVDWNSGNTIVPIYTRYRLKHPEMAQAMREKSDVTESSRVKLFPNRVNAMIGR